MSINRTAPYVVQGEEKEQKEQQEQKEEQETMMMDKSQEMRVFTLNCWLLKGISRNRKERSRAIGDFLARGEFDVVFLQEVWTAEDFETIRRLCEDVLPHSHHFGVGVIGSGTAIFSRVRIFDATFHEFSLNGQPHKVAHGDWFGGKGIGVCQVFFKVR